MSEKPLLRDILLLLTLGFVWGSSFALIKLTVGEIPTLTMVAGRLIAASLLLGGVALLRRELFPQTPGEWAGVAMVGVIGNALPFFLITWGQEQVDSSVAAILMAFMPVATVVIAHFTSKAGEPLTWKRLLGVAFGFSAVMIIIGPSALGGFGEAAIRETAIAAAALCYATATVIIRTLPKGDPVARAAVMSIVAALVMTPFAFVIEQPLAIMPSSTALMAWAALSIGASGAGIIIQFHLVNSQGAGFTSMVNFIVPVVGVILGAVFLAERIPPAAFLALGMILAGVFLTGGGRRRAK